MNNGMTIRELGQRCGLSRATLLYYDRLGLLRAARRSGGNYRLYGPPDLRRLEQICLYRGMGIPLKEIARLLDQAASAGPTQSILQRRLATLETQIESLHQQQRQIVRLLEQFGQSASTRGNRAQRARARPAGKGKQVPSHKEKDVISKKRWVEIMTAAGLTEEDKHNWHRQFEKMEPQAHQEFLESLGIDAEEIKHIREWSRK